MEGGEIRKKSKKRKADGDPMGQTIKEQQEEEVEKDYSKFGRPKRDGEGHKLNQFRDLCFCLQMNGTKLKTIQDIIEKEKNNKVKNLILKNFMDHLVKLQTPEDKFLSTYMDVPVKFTFRETKRLTTTLKENKNIQDPDVEKFATKIGESIKEFVGGSKQYVHSDEWFSRLYSEMDKFILMQRMFIGIRKRIESLRRVKRDCTLKDILLKYEVEFINQTDNFRCDSFFKMLEKIGVIRNNTLEDCELLIDEYGF